MTSDKKISETQERKQMHDRYRDDLLKRHLSNAENFDRAILTYSAAGLAISLSFQKNFVEISHAVLPWLLYVSWACFILAIITTVVSYPIGQRGINKQLEFAENYYIKEMQEAFNAPNIWATLIEIVNLSAGFLFILAVILTTLFVYLNLQRV